MTNPKDAEEERMAEGMDHWTVEGAKAAVVKLEAAIADYPFDKGLRINLMAARRMLDKALERRAAALAELAAMDGETM